MIMKNTLYKFLTIIFIILSNSFIYGCSNKDVKEEIPLTPIIPKIEPLPNDSSANLKTFAPYPSPESLVSKIEIGKEDPFSFGMGEGKASFSSEVIFTGIISNGEKIYALVKYKDKSGTIQVGDEGMISTDLLPKNVKVVDIDIKEDTLNLKYKNKIYYLTINSN